ncbi:MAG: NADH-quinone oxidoreductase subunit C, partial [Bdellovibrionales bacterium]|nr:NADH-quinone oxidoreductase subunit C [Bdellovibrionales bacterium]
MNIIESLKGDLDQKFPNSGFQFTYAFGNNVVSVAKEFILPLVRHFKATRRFDFLMQVAGADFPERERRFEIAYEFFSSKDSRRCRLKTQVGEHETIDSVISVWKCADWFEREIFDMYGVQFSGHPNLRRILTHHQFVGHPLRKDYPADRQQHCTEALPIHFDYDPRFENEEERELVPLNIGPSHPATHGTLRVMVALDGEKVHRAGVELGYLHRCFEKMAETHPYNQVIPYTDRLNYCSAPMNNVGYCKAVEKMLEVEIPPRAQAMRIILAELSRVIDHLVCIGAN